MDLDGGQLEALSAAVAEGTFDAAARRLHVTPSAVSQRIKALEVATGRVLLTRTKPVRPTPSGEVLLRTAHQTEAILAEAARDLGGDGDHGQVVPIAVNADSLATWFLPALASLDTTLRFDLRRSDEEQTATLLRDGTVMAAVTAQADPVPGCTCEVLGAMRYRPMASPAFVAAWFPGGATPGALAVAPVVVFDRDDRLQDRYLRRRSRRPLDPPRHHVPGSSAFLRAVALGLGWGMVPDLQATADLVELDPGGPLDVRLHWQRWRLPTATLAAVSSAVRAAAATTLR